MQSYSIRVPNTTRLASFLNLLQSRGFDIQSLESISGHTIVVVKAASFPPEGMFLLQEDGSFILLEDGFKIVLN
jgi:hypothetical protein